MSNIEIVLGAVLVIVAGIVVGRLGAAWWRYRGKRVIACPENHQAAGVSLDVKHAALTALRGETNLRLTACSRWPERAGCGQDCLFQIERSPEDCLVRNILVHWYEGKTCVWCGRPIGEIHLAGRKPALLTADKGSVEWSEVPAEQLPETLAVAQPLCFSCHVANTMVREHPELVIDRSRPVMVAVPAEKK
jgi:hypothetical protein